MRILIFLAGILLVVCASCSRKPEQNDLLFTLLPGNETGVKFRNELTDSDSLNIIKYLYFYNGGGVAVGDINNDGLPDIYFTANQHANKLYLNKGDFVFEDITITAGVGGDDEWTTGVTMADVNGDGWLDIYVCQVGGYRSMKGRNKLYINNGDLTFTEQAAAYGLDHRGFSTHASFFDYDNDGDLDVYLVNHSVHSTRTYGDISLRHIRDERAGDKLMRNDGDHFTDVSSEAGIIGGAVGYGLSVSVSDINMDGWIDIYVCNDFRENDYLYLNNGDGTFKQVIQNSLGHSSRFSMGSDIGDVNNDGLPDIVSLDMLPYDEPVIKASAGEDSYEIYQFKLSYGYYHQLMRNTMQLNRGIVDGIPLFSDIAPLAGVEATDWSWASLLADFDNDGFSDLFISNGIVKRPNDLDYINFISTDSVQRYFADQQFIEKMPSGKAANVMFHNKGDLAFDNITSKWMVALPGFSAGAAYADLDNDGDLDLIVNNINEEAFIYRNETDTATHNFLKIKVEGDDRNKFGIGTKVYAYIGKDLHYREIIPSRGWQSSVDYTVHLGLGSKNVIDSLVIVWPDRRSNSFYRLPSNQTIVVKQSSANRIWKYTTDKKQDQLFEQADNDVIQYFHREDKFVPFNRERLIPHALSSQGPKMAVGDINGDGLEDIFITGSKGHAGSVFLQDNTGRFTIVRQPAMEADSLAEDVAGEFFDADGDGDLDLIVVGGGQEYEGNNKWLRPRLYLNDGQGIFSTAIDALPEIYVNASCVRLGDIDGDGDMDIFIGGHVLPGRYGYDPPSYILENDGSGKFKDITNRILPGPENIPRSLGMVADAAWADINKDGLLDLIVVGEWMPVTVLIRNQSGVLEDRTKEFGLDKTNGWWNTIHAADFDKDGDLDFVVGNVGLNSRLRASTSEPVSLFAGDFDDNGGTDHIITYFNNGKSHPFLSRDQLVAQLPHLKRKFLKYSSYKDVKLEDIITPEQQSQAINKFSTEFASVYLENDEGKFNVRLLPREAQMFPVFSILSEDVNGDGFLDIVMAGNRYAVQPDIGRQDAGYGLVLTGDGKGNFSSVPLFVSGFCIQGEGRDIKSVFTSEGKLFLISRNNASIKSYLLK